MQHTPGWALVVDLTTGTQEKVNVPLEFVKLYGGGRGFNSRILYEFKLRKSELEDVVLISPGLLTGSKFPSTSRVTISVLNSAVSKRFSDSSLGGFFASYFRVTGCTCLLIKGQASSSKILRMDGDKIDIVDTPVGLQTLDVPALSSYFQTQYSIEHGITHVNVWKSLVNGISGENGVWCAGLYTDQRLAAAAGAGKVFGRMNLKAIIVPEKTEEFITPQATVMNVHWHDTVEKGINKIKTHPVYKMFSKFGTTSLVEIHSALKYFPSFNFNKNEFPDWKKISGKASFDQGKDWRKEREDLNDQGLLNCRECPILCSAPNRMEYEGLQCLGSKIGSSDLAYIKDRNKWFEVVGADLIQPTGVISAIMDMYADGVIRFRKPPVQPTWGNQEFVTNFLNGLMYQRSNTPSEEVGMCFRDGFNEGFEMLLKKDLATMDISIEEANETYFVAVKNMALSGVMPSKGHKGVAIAISTSTRGACHLRSLPTLASYAQWYFKSMKVRKLLDMFKIPLQAISIMKVERSNITKSLYPNYVKRFGVPQYVADEWQKSGFLFAEEDDYNDHAIMIWFTQSEYAAADCFGQCRFTSCWRFGIGPLLVAEAGTALSGITFDERDVMTMGERVYAIERELLFMYDQTPADDKLDRLPKKFYGKEWSITKEGYQLMLSQYYKRCGYDETGRPRPNVLETLVHSREKENDEISNFLNEVMA